MPRCLLVSLKRQHLASKVRNDPYVMVTRSGLSIPRIHNGYSSIPSSGLSVSTKISTSIPAATLSNGSTMSEQRVWTSVQGQDKQRTNLGVLYKSYKSRSSPASSLSAVTRYELLEYGIVIESKDINTTNQPSRFLVTKEQFLRNTSNVGDSALDTDMLSLESTSPINLMESEPELNESAPIPGNKLSLTSAVSVSLPAISVPTNDDELNPIPVPLVIDVPFLASSLDESTSSSDSTPIFRKSEDVTKSPPAQGKPRHPLLDLLESQGEIKIHDLSPKDLKERIQQYVMPCNYGVNCRNLFKCAICRKVYGGMEAFAEHINSHLKLKNRCHVCGRVFTRHWLLKGHLRVHTGERPFVCEICGKAFADRSNLRSHILIHTATNKTHQCSKCGKSFALKRYLQKHSLEVCKMEVNSN